MQTKEQETQGHHKNGKLSKAQISNQFAAFQISGSTKMLLKYIANKNRQLNINTPQETQR